VKKNFLADKQMAFQFSPKPQKVTSKQTASASLS